METNKLNVKRFVSNERGEGLVSVLAAVPAVVFASLLVGTMVHATYNEVNRFRVRGESGSLQQELRLTLDTGTSCAESLTGANHFNTHDATSAEGMDMTYRLSDGSIAATDTVLEKYGLKVNSLKFKAFTNGGLNFAEDPRVSGNMLQYGELVINTSDLSKGIARRDQSLGGVVLSVASNGNISRCFLLDKGFEMCAESGGTLDADNKCIFPSPCPIGQMNSGWDGSGHATCVTPAALLANSCPAGMVLVSNGAGGASCQVVTAASPSPTPSPSPSPSPSASPTVSPTASPTVTPSPTPTPSPSPSPTPKPTGPMDPHIIYTLTQLENVSSKMSADCKTFLSNTSPLDLTATNDVTIDGSMPAYLLESARSFTANGVASKSVTVNSAVNVPLLKGATDFYVRTQYMDQMFSGGDKFLMVLKHLNTIYTSAGPICASAESIDLLKGVAGQHHIIAKSIGLVDRGSGSLHIYGATINTVDGYVGNICLFNGAKILNLINAPLAKVKTDCP